MDTCNWGSVKAEQPTSMDVEGGDWRSYLQMNSRQRIVNKIIETLKRHLPFSEQDGLHELRKIAVRLEEKIYTAATSQSDYLRKISLKMLTMETNSQNQNPVSKSMPSNSNGNGANPSDPEKIFASTLKQLNSVDTGDDDWRSQLPLESRQRIVNNIMERLKRHLPISSQEGLHELEKFALSVEEKIYSAATSQSDYLRKISLKMLSLETKSQNQNPMANSFASKSDGYGENPPDSEKFSASTLKQPNSMDIGDGDWRSQLQLESRQRIVNKIMEALRKHLPFSGQEGLHELKKIAVRLEENIYTAATSQSDYLRKISLKLLTMEKKSQNLNPMANSFASNSDGYGENPPYPEKFSASTLKQPNSMDIGDGDWRSQLQLESRQRIVNKIMEALRKHLPFSGQEGLHELKKLAVRLEENIYTAATSQFDYLRKISLKLLTMEKKSQNQNPMAISSASNSDGYGENPPYPGIGDPSS